MAMKALTTESVLAALQMQVGRESALKASDLVEQITNLRTSPGAERRLRQIVKRLRLDGYPVCAHSDCGYYWARTPEDLKKACDFLRGKAMSSLQQITKLNRLALPPLVGQIEIVPAPPTLRWKAS